MYVTAINNFNKNYPINNVDFRAKKIPVKNPEKVSDAMALMSGALAVAGIVTKAKEKPDTTNKEQMTNEEFRALKAEIAAKLQSYDIDINHFKITKNNVLILSKLVENPIFIKEDSNDKFMTINFAISGQSKEVLDAKTKFLETVGKDDEIITHLGLNTFLYRRIKSEQDAENIIQLYNYVINNETLHNYLKDNHDLYENSNKRYSFYHLYYDLETNVQLLPRIMEDENLKDNFINLVRTRYTEDKNYGVVLDTFSKKKELLQNKNVTDRLNSDNRLTLLLLDALSFNKVLNIEDKDVMNNILQVTDKHDTNNESSASLNTYQSFMNALLNTKELYKNKDISENLETILDTKPQSKVLRNDRVAIIEKIDSSEKLMQNQELMNNIGKILATIKTHDNYLKIMKALEQIDNT